MKESDSYRAFLVVGDRNIPHSAQSMVEQLHKWEDSWKRMGNQPESHTRKSICGSTVQMSYSDAQFSQQDPSFEAVTPPVRVACLQVVYCSGVAKEIQRRLEVPNN